MYVLIPAYQPDARLPRLILELHRAYPSTKIVVVDDGSGEQYRDIFEASHTAGAHVISYERNRGKGYALRAGFSYIHEQAQTLGLNDCVVTADADGQHTLNDIFRVGRTCTDTGESVLGVPGSATPLLQPCSGSRRAGNSRTHRPGCAHSRWPCFPRCSRSREIVTNTSSASFCTWRSSVIR